MVYRKIYIPLWFYSNTFDEMLVFAKQILFTFHFGFILTLQTLQVEDCAMLFTFHFGFILTNFHTLGSATLTFIYIPLWFYSNQFSTFSLSSSLLFTFHFGFILTLNHIVLPSTKLDLHSTLVLF